MIDLIVNPDSIRSSFGGASTQIFSEIYFSINGEFFPEEGWDDFSAIILGWWLSGTMSIMQQKNSDENGENFYFMDGNYCFGVSAKGDLFHINFMSNDKSGAKIITSDIIEQTSFLKLLTQSANLILRVSNDKKIDHKDIDSLRQHFKSAQKFIKLFVSKHSEDNNGH